MIRLIALLIVKRIYSFVFWISWLHTYVKLVRKHKGFNNAFKKEYGEYMYFNAWGLDQAASPVVSHSFSDWFVMPGGYKFGGLDVTLSHSFGKNKYNEKGNSLYPSGRKVGKLIDWLFKFAGDVDENGNPNHLKKAAKAPQFNP